MRTTAGTHHRLTEVPSGVEGSQVALPTEGLVSADLSRRRSPSPCRRTRAGPDAGPAKVSAQTFLDAPNGQSESRGASLVATCCICEPETCVRLVAGVVAAAGNLSTGLSTAREATTEGGAGAPRGRPQVVATVRRPAP